MPLIEKLAGEVEDAKISVHALASTLRLIKGGVITKTQAAARWPELTGADLTELNTILNRIEANTLDWNDLEACLILCEAGKATAAETRTLLGL